MKAVIMAGGEGTRLRPLTSNLPKPMAPLVGRPMMEHIVELLRGHGFDDIVVTLAFMPNAIRDYFGDGSEFGVRMTYTVEDTPLGTAGSVRNAADLLDEPFLVISGDVLTDIDLGSVVAFHRERGALATIGLTPVENPLEFGIVITRDDGSVERFLEKPTWGEVFSDTINTGIFVLEPRIFDWVEADTQVDFSGDVFPRLLEAGEPLYGAVAEGYWEDVGTLSAYLAAHKDVLDQKVRVRIPGFEVRPGVWLGEGADVDPDADLVGPAVIGDNCRLEAGVRVGEYTVLGSNVRVRRDADLERVVALDNAYLGNGVRLRGTVIGRNCDLRSGARTEDGVVLGDEVFVGENAVLSPSVKVYPFKTVEAGAVVNTSLVYESRGARSLFGRAGVAGLANVDITPELAVRVAMAFASTMKKGDKVITSRDSSRAARMLKRAMMAGLNASGVDVDDLEVASVPVTRFWVRSPRAMGGITVRLSRDDPQSVVLRFFDGNGADVTESTQRKIERQFQREDFRMVFPAEIGDIGFAPRALEHYTAALLSSMDGEAVAATRFKAVIDYGFGSTSFVMPNVLAKLGADVLAVNPYASTREMIEFDAGAHVRNVANLVRASGADLGAVIEPDGEHVTLIDDEGRELSPTEAQLTVLALMAELDLGGRTVAMPVSASRAAQRMVEQAGAEVCWSKLSVASVMDAAAGDGVVLALTSDGGLMFPEFLPALDGAATFVKVLELLARTGQRLSKVVANLPRVHVARDTVVTPWEQKGLVMRSLVESNQGRDLVLVDGVKVEHGEGWALAQPDPEEPVTHLWAEAATDADAERLVREYARRIRQLVR